MRALLCSFQELTQSHHCQSHHCRRDLRRGWELSRPEKPRVSWGRAATWPSGSNSKATVERSEEGLAARMQYTQETEQHSKGAASQIH